MVTKTWLGNCISIINQIINNRTNRSRYYLIFINELKASTFLLKFWLYQWIVTGLSRTCYISLKFHIKVIVQYSIPYVKAAHNSISIALLNSLSLIPRLYSFMSNFQLQIRLLIRDSKQVLLIKCFFLSTFEAMGQLTNLIFIMTYLWKQVLKTLLTSF